MESLTNISSDLKIVPLNRLDVTHDSPTTRNFVQLILSQREMYPGIEKWLSQKVLPEIGTLKRSAYIGYNHGQPIASAVVKKGINSKICNLYIRPELQNHHLGEIFFAVMALEIKHSPVKVEEVHFTLPESLWLEKKEFFASFGFTNVQRAHRQYRLFDEEYCASAPYSVFWQNVLNKLPKIVNCFTKAGDSIFNGVLFSIKPTHLEKIKNRQKTVEIRKKFNTRFAGKKAIFYSSSPTRALAGFATIQDVIEDDPQRIWLNFGKDIGCTHEEYFTYAKGSNKLFAIKLTDVNTYLNDIYLNTIEPLIEKKITPPQSYLLIENSPSWSEALSIVELMHRRFRDERINSQYRESRNRAGEKLAV